MGAYRLPRLTLDIASVTLVVPGGIFEPFYDSSRWVSAQAAPVVTKQPWQLWAYLLPALLPVVGDSWSPWQAQPHAT